MSSNQMKLSGPPTSLAFENICAVRSMRAGEIPPLLMSHGHESAGPVEYNITDCDELMSPETVEIDTKLLLVHTPGTRDSDSDEERWGNTCVCIHCSCVFFHEDEGLGRLIADKG